MISGAGKIGNTNCTLDTWFLGPFTNGTARITAPAACTFTASLSFAGLQQQVVHATLSKDKQSAFGVGKAGRDTFVFGLIRL